MIIDNLPTIPSTVTAGDELAVERGTTTYKIDYNALAAAILSQARVNPDSITLPYSVGTENTAEMEANLNTILSKMAGSQLFYTGTAFKNGLMWFWGYNYNWSPNNYADIYYQVHGHGLIHAQLDDNVWTIQKGLPIISGGTGATTADAACANIDAVKRTSTPVSFGGSEANFSANLVTLLGNMAIGESRIISTSIGEATDNFTGYAAYYGILYKIDSKFATGIITDNVRSTVLIGRSNSDIVYFSALTKAAVVPVNVGGTGANTPAGARANIGSGCPSGTFTTADGKTVTVANGFITAIT